MQFRELKAGGTLYIYDRQAIDLTVASITSVSMPRMDKLNNIPTMMVDISADNKTYSFKDASEIGYVGNYIISADRELILKEIEAQKANDESLINRYDSIKEELPKLEKVIDTLNPALKEKKVQEERLNRMEETIGSLKEMLELVIKSKKNG